MVGMIPIGAELPKSSLWKRAFFLFSQVSLNDQRGQLETFI